MKTPHLRSRYFEVLKLALLDISGTSTATLTSDGIFEVPVDNAQRALGRDWPAHGLTMIGRRRLDHLQELVERVVQKNVKGDLIEAGVWRGGASLLMKAVLDAYGDRKRRVVLADSFRGLPPPAKPRGDIADGFHRFNNYLGVPRKVVESHFERYGLLDDRVEFVEGLFAKTMPTLTGRRWSLIRLDGDLYESIMPPLEHLYNGLSRGGFVVIDDYGPIPQARDAVDEFRQRARITTPLHDIDGNASFWCKT
jgi:O-methyltransferase